MTPLHGAPALRTRLRRNAPFWITVAVTVVVCSLAAWILIPRLSSPSSRLVEWHLGDLDPVTAQTATVIPITTDEYPPEECYAPAT